MSNDKISKVQQRANDALASNFADVMENGPGLRYSIKHEAIARTADGNWVLRTGLGGMGVGTMWCQADDCQRQDPLWDELPIQEREQEGTLRESVLAELDTLKDLLKPQK